MIWGWERSWLFPASLLISVKVTASCCISKTSIKLLFWQFCLLSAFRAVLKNMVVRLPIAINTARKRDVRLGDEGMRLTLLKKLLARDCTRQRNWRISQQLFLFLGAERFIFCCESAWIRATRQLFIGQGGDTWIGMENLGKCHAKGSVRKSLQMTPSPTAVLVWFGTSGLLCLINEGP